MTNKHSYLLKAFDLIKVHTALIFAELSTKKILIIILLLTNICFAVNYELYIIGFELVKQDRIPEACRFWTDLGESMVELNPGDTIKTKEAAFAYILATIGWEKLDNAKAYQTWAKSIQIYLESSTNWETERLKYSAYYEHLRNSLSSGVGLQGIAVVTRSDLTLIDLERELAITSFSGPQPGLKRKEYYPDQFGGSAASDQSSTSIILKTFPSAESEKLNDADEPPPYSRGIYWFPENVSDTTVNPLLDTTIQVIPIEEYPSDFIFTRTVALIDSFNLQENDNFHVTDFSAQSMMINPEAFSEEILSDSYTEIDIKAASAAWRYFSANYNPATGFVNSVHNYKYTTLWDLASSLAGFISAHQLGIIDSSEFFFKIDRFLSTLGNLTLYNNELPNRNYNTATGEIGGRMNGWSALDIGRLLIWLKITSEYYPFFSDKIEGIIKSWNFDRLKTNDVMNGIMYSKGKETLRQEGRLGYEQYSATGYELWGINLPGCFDYGHVDSVEINGINIFHDTRNLPFLTSEPFYLCKIELGEIDPFFNEMTHRIYEVQKRQSEKTGQLISVSEDALSREPWFAYNTIFYEGNPWHCVSHLGEPLPTLKNLSTKSAFAWSLVYPDVYSLKLKAAIINLQSPERGFYAGIFEDGKVNVSLNINTNGLILEIAWSLKKAGSFLKQ